MCSESCLRTGFVAWALFLCGATAPCAPAATPFRAGAAAVDITPAAFPVIVNGGFLEKRATKAVDPLHARALVMDDGTTRVALCVVDTCMMTRELIDSAKEQAHKATGIPVERMLVSATHTHSAPSAMACLGTRLDPQYAAFLPGKISEAISAAAGNLRDARVGWAAVPAWEYTNCRRWIRRPDRMITDPFGVVSGRAHMHPGYQNPDAIGPSGPIDPDLSLLSVQAPDGKPLALLANFSMHYFGATPVSADYFGKFASGIGRHIGADGSFVGIMSQGTSGDSHWMDYSRPKRDISGEQYADGLIQFAAQAYRGIEHRDSAPIAMAEARLKLRRRVADESRLAWARKIADGMGDRVAANQPEVYAREQLIIAAEPERELKLQALRIGGAGITAIPNEVYAITGLKLKAQSPLRPTFNIELANGSEGYIPPPEQHKLGGYTTWAARTAGLVPEAEPRIVETVLGLLEEVAGAKRRKIEDPPGAYAEAVLAAKPLAYWRMNEFGPPKALDSSGNGNDATYDWEHGVAFHLPGVGNGMGASSQPSLAPTAFAVPGRLNRSPHFAGGSMSATLKAIGTDYTASFWIWNGLDPKARATTGVIFSRGNERLGITGTSSEPGHLFFAASASDAPLIGKSTLLLKDWHHVAFIRDGRKVMAYLDGKLELSGETNEPSRGDALSVGGGASEGASFEGRIDEVAIFGRALSPAQIATQYQVSGLPPRAPLITAGSTTIATDPPPLPPAESLEKIHVPAGYRVELIAAEPLVQDPVAFDWDVAGRLWVVEMADYPLGMDGNGKAGGRVRVLEDTDGDGRYDKSTLFAEGLNFPNGIITWRDGVLVTAAPEILFLKDTDGDGKADVRETLFTGFFEGNQQLRVNGLRWGLDNWIYCAIGSHHSGYASGTRLKCVRTGAEFELGSRDFRFRPDTCDFDPQSGPTQFGRNRDDWGRWFGTMNSWPLWHYVLTDQYLRRNPHVAAPVPLLQVVGPRNPKVYPASAQEKRFHSFAEAGHFTSACSGMIYRDELLFARGAGTHAFTCEPFHNLVQHNVLTDAGVSFASHRAPGEETRDFFASEDRWCRPVMTRTGPDGALWVADMYRYMIEHPQFLTAQGKEELMPHYRAGEDRGRIYRVLPAGAAARKPVRLDRLDTARLVAALDSPNGWQRDKAQQLLLWRNDRAAIPHLETLAAQSGNPLARLHALCTLDGLSALGPEPVERALRDSHPGVRENALRLAESRGAPPVVAAAVHLADDADSKVRLQLAFSLGQWRDPAAGRALGRLAVASHGDGFLIAAVMSSATPHARAVVDAVVDAGGRALETLTEPLLHLSLGLNDRVALARLLAPALSAGGHFTPGQVAVFTRLVDALAQRKQSLSDLRNANQDELSTLLAKADAMLAQARESATDPKLPPAERIAAASLLSRDPARRAEAGDLLAGWLTPQAPSDAQAPAIRGLAATGAPDVPARFAKAWPALGPSARQVLLDEWLSREQWALDLLQRIQKAELSAASIDPARRSRLLRNDSGRIRQLAAKVFDSAGSRSRAKIVEDYRAALSATGDASRGHAVYQRLCSVCHKRGNEGKDIGPDLFSVAGHPPEKLLINILDPNVDIQPGFHAYTCALKTGEELYGLVAAETGNSITMKMPDGTMRTVPRANIATLRSANISLMPEGLEGGISKQEMADLIEFLRTPPAAAQSAPPAR